MRLCRQLFSLVCLVAIGHSVAVLAADKPQALNINISPRVGRVQDISGEVGQVGRPVIFVRSGKEGEPWWTQNFPLPVGPKQFKARLIFGNERSVQGSKFHVVAMLLPPNASPQSFKVGQQLQQLPNLPASDEIIVTLGTPGDAPAIEVVPTTSAFHAANENKAAEAEAPMSSVEITSPEDDSEVTSPTDLIGTVGPNQHPVALIRGAGKEANWIVQSKITTEDDGSFKCRLGLGTKSTPDGTRFRIVVLTFDSAQLAAKLKPGTALKQLPAGVPATDELTVTLSQSKK